MGEDKVRMDEFLQKIIFDYFDPIYTSGKDKDKFNNNFISLYIRDCNASSNEAIKELMDLHRHKDKEYLLALKELLFSDPKYLKFFVTEIINRYSYSNNCV